MQLMNRTKILRRRVLRLVPFAAIALAIAATIPASSLTPSAALPAPLPIADLAQKGITLTSPLETTPPITQQTAERSLHGYFGDVSVGLPVLRQVHLGFVLRGRADCTCWVFSAMPPSGTDTPGGPAGHLGGPVPISYFVVMIDAQTGQNFWSMEVTQPVHAP